ncbi:CDP-diacylglycerol--glycerol-3-phosphate 3-phosphatidyltransferase [Desulfospira joergensenii]|uniref:CDP-diacylglycerol--glycerol-3-phosphate 3-phosphatidyltransferase n=1 Tax=Desulfospira joergensenii TaxID=53329 RepID=UPI0003B3CFAC|nr:CDP-diacylglycerol--glycerol-3-phosphate 3-phosphatidyltransferase [Desulfospira joergensenii]
MTWPEKVKEAVLTPNFITLSRIVSIPVIMGLLTCDHRWTTLIAALLFSLASVTDYLDGYLARTRGLITPLGKILDPLADKLLVSSTLIMLVGIEFIPGWIASLIIGRELAVTGLRCVLIERGQDVSASWLGKVKTGFQIAAIIPLTLHYPYLGIDFTAVGQFFLYGALLITVWSGTDYFIKAKKYLVF